jgi:hypothetical protein
VFAHKSAHVSGLTGGPGYWYTASGLSIVKPRIQDMSNVTTEKGGAFFLLENKYTFSFLFSFTVFSLWERKEFFQVGTDVAFNGVCLKRRKVRRLARPEQLIRLL